MEARRIGNELIGVCKLQFQIGNQAISLRDPWLSVLASRQVWLFVRIKVEKVLNHFFPFN
jgi:hypothetical protein